MLENGEFLFELCNKIHKMGVFMKNIVRKKLEHLLEITDWGLQELSNRSGLPYDTVKSIYYGRIENPRIETLIAIADAFTISLDFLVGRIDYAVEDLKHLLILKELSDDTKETIEYHIKRELNKKSQQ